MALGKRCGSSLKSKRIVGDEELRLGSVRYARAFGRKRILISNHFESLSMDSAPKTPSKKMCGGERLGLDSERSFLEALPQDILIRVLCGVNHKDLKQLFHVSKLIREATLIAKQWHFAYSTPSKTRAFRSATDLENPSELDDEIEAPNAPKQFRPRRSRLPEKKLADISVALFASPDEEHWPRKALFMETEI